ncbi:MAG: hypothetical protein BWX70_00003 [Verrucomicrobia bacterium ADurb.Bin070]|nr:MAG: hypothetical protein BWX70_00003 [Verrucomicrobia bacterium ADurb.Bin070]
MGEKMNLNAVLAEAIAKGAWRVTRKRSRRCAATWRNRSGKWRS